MHEIADRPLSSRERVVFAGALAAFAVVAALCSACAPPARFPVEDPTLAREYARVVRIDVQCDDGGHIGSGVRVGGSAVLTAMHVITCDEGLPSAMKVTDASGVTRAARMVAISPADVARLEVAGLSDMSDVDVASTVVGERLCATFAFPELGRRCGDTWPHASKAPGDVIVDFVAEKGNSGAAVWDARGRLVGILVYQRSCAGVDTPQICTAGVTSLWPRRWLAAP